MARSTNNTAAAGSAAADAATQAQIQQMMTTMQALQQQNETLQAQTLAVQAQVADVQALRQHNEAIQPRTSKFRIRWPGCRLSGNRTRPSSNRSISLFRRTKCVMESRFNLKDRSSNPFLRRLRPYIFRTTSTLLRW